MKEESERRSNIMRAVKSKDTGPEMAVRRLVHGMGYRYRLHRKDLPGNPDMVFGPRRKVIFVHGCFWHGHSCKRGCRIPKNNRDYWLQKIERNRERDRENLRTLKKGGWRTLVMWECQIKDKGEMERRIRGFLDGE